MPNIEYLSFNDVDPTALMSVVNEDSLRTHLVDHPYVDAATIQAWIEDKIKTDAMRSCRVRVVTIDGELAG